MPRAKASLLLMLITALTVAVLLALPYTPARVVRTATVETGDLLRTVLMSGTVGYVHQQFCVNLQPGVVRAVHVQAGQQVQAGQLLFSMDTSAQEAALASLYRLKNESAQTVDALAVLTAQNQLEWAETERQLSQAIQAAQIRAEKSGVVEAVYAAQGDHQEGMSLLGSVRSTEKCVIVSARAKDCLRLSKETAAVLEQNGQPLGAARIESIHAPEETGSQQLMLLPFNQQQLADCTAGEVVTVEAVTERVEGCALIPLSAVDDKGCVWYVQNGQAYCETISTASRSAYAVAAEAKWSGRRVILSAQSEQLKQGCRVKEAKD